jgi:hypothetical protein
MRPDDDHNDHADDDALLALLGEALRAAEPVPPHVLAAARGAVAWRTIDEELADLVFDSATELTGVRDHDGTASRQLTFRAQGIEVEVMLVDPAERRLVGQLVPPQETEVRIDSPTDSVEQRSDAFGRFTFDSVATGPVRIGVAGADGQPDVVTDWVLL